MIQEPIIKYRWWVCLGAGLTIYPTIYLAPKVKGLIKPEIGQYPKVYLHELDHWVSQKAYVNKYGGRWKGLKKWFSEYFKELFTFSTHWSLKYNFSWMKVSFEREAYHNETDPK